MADAMHKVYLGLGSNLGDRRQNIARAIQLIGERVGQVVRQSSLLESEPWGFDSSHLFLNAVVLCMTDKTPMQTLLLTQQIERDLGRRKTTGIPSEQGGTNRQYADRPIDIDILLYDDLVVDEPDLKIPHPLMQKRDFVMIPLNEITNN